VVNLCPGHESDLGSVQQVGRALQRSQAAEGLVMTLGAREQKEQCAICLDLGSFARCLKTRDYHGLACADLPLPPLWLHRDYLHFQ